jgi:L-asparagine oxygenase
LGYKQEQDGRIIQDIFPIAATATQQISTSSAVELAMHTETSFHDFRPSQVMLLCMRGDPGAATTISAKSDIFRRLPIPTLRTLMQPRFTTTIDESFRLAGEPDREVTISIINEESDGSLSLRYDEALTRGIDAEAHDALAAFTDAAKAAAKDVVLATGDLLIINNRHVIHGRRKFAARHDGTDRWLQRMMVFDYDVPSIHLDGCVITTDL